MQLQTTMNRSSIISAIHHVLENELHTPGLENFGEHSRLNEDLYLDSILILQLLVSLESKLGIEIPDDALSADDFKTVFSLADFLLAHSAKPGEAALGEQSPQTQEAEEFLDIKVHCFVSCLCEIIKADARVDHRPFYFGVWDAEVVVDENFHLNYHSATINHDFFRKWYRSLYGVAVKPWYEDKADKSKNIDTLLRLLDKKPPTQQIMVMLDMFRLPERENKFNQNPFPHYVLLEKTQDPDTWFMYDPDFRWEGTQQKSQVIYAIESDAVGGGYVFDSREIQASSKRDIYDYFLACFNVHSNPMTDSVSTIVNYFTRKQDTKPDDRHKGLAEAIKQLPVLAIRKYAYEHGFAYFWRELGHDDEAFEAWCEVIEELVSSYKKIHYRAIKLGQFAAHSASSHQLITEIVELLAQQNHREFTIKQGLLKEFNRWCAVNHLPLFAPSSSLQSPLLEAGI